MFFCLSVDFTPFESIEKKEYWMVNKCHFLSRIVANAKRIASPFSSREKHGKTFFPSPLLSIAMLLLVSSVSSASSWYATHDQADWSMPENWLGGEPTPNNLAQIRNGG